MPAPVHPGRLLRRELKARELSANRLALDLGVPSGRITDILNEHRSISADTVFRLANTCRSYLNFHALVFALLSFKSLRWLFADCDLDWHHAL